MADDRAAKHRKLAAKRLNEHLKLVASALNTIGIAVLGAAFILPAIGGSVGGGSITWIAVAVGLHMCGHVALRFMRSED